MQPPQLVLGLHLAINASLVRKSRSIISLSYLYFSSQFSLCIPVGMEQAAAAEHAEATKIKKAQRAVRKVENSEEDTSD